MKFYPITRHRNLITQDYINEQVRCGAPGFDTFEQAEYELYHRMDTDDSDYDVYFYDGNVWRATRDGVTALKLPVL